MNKRTHKNKLHLARTLMSKAEKKKKVSPFQSKNWNIRRSAKAGK